MQKHIAQHSTVQGLRCARKHVRRDDKKKDCTNDRRVKERKKVRKK